MKIYASDLSSASQVFKNGLDSIKSSADSMNIQIDNFVNSSELKNNLKGLSWDSARNYMNTYSSTFNSLKEVCDSLSNSIVSANNSVIKAMKGYSPVDIDSEEQLKEKVRKINEDLVIAKANMYKKKKDVNSKGKVTFVPTGEIIPYWTDRVKEYEREVQELTELIKIVSETKAAYEKAKSLMSGEASDILTSFISKANAFVGK